MANRTTLQDKYDKLEKELNKIKEKIQKNEPLFKEGQKVMLKENLIIVEIVKRSIEKKKNRYCVIYPHLKGARDFWVDEEELQERPIDYNQIIYNAYLEYKYKYDDLLRRLYSPNVREKY